MKTNAIIDYLFKTLPEGPGEGKLEGRRIKGASKTPPKKYREGGATEKDDYADPNNYKYPIDNEKHVRAALAYFGKPENNKMYKPEEKRAIAGRIMRAAKKYNIKVSDEWQEKFGIKKADVIKAEIDLLLAKNIGKLVKKQIIDKRGRRQTVWVRPEGMKKRVSRRPGAPQGYNPDAWNHFVDFAIKQKKMAAAIMKERGRYDRLPESTQKTVKEFHTKPVSVLAREYYDASKRAAEKGNPKAKAIWEKFGGIGTDEQ